MDPTKNRVFVERVNMIKKHMKPNNVHKQGGIIEKEASLHISKVMLICPKCNEPTGIANQVLEDGRKIRACKKCKEVMDQ